MKIMICKTCGIEKSINEFYNNSPKYRMHQCKSCFKKRQSEWTKDNPLKNRQQAFYSRKRKQLNELSEYITFINGLDYAEVREDISGIL